jgi:hypothetical protein
MLFIIMVCLIVGHAQDKNPDINFFHMGIILSHYLLPILTFKQKASTTIRQTILINNITN